MRSFIGAVGGNVDVDFMDENYNTAHSASYEGVSPARVLSSITSFYDEGIKPKGNVSYSVEREGFVKGNAQNGLFERVIRSDYGGELGSLMTETFEYKDGKRNGKYTFVWDSGYRGEGAFVDDKPEGKFIEIYPDGNIAMEVTYKDGAREGNVSESYSLVGVRGAKEWDDMEKALGRESIVRLDNLAVAREMETSGKDAKSIRLATGWERGVDGKWRYEMEDMFPDDIEERIKDAIKEGDKGVDLMQIIGYKHPVAVYHTPYKYKVVAFNNPNSARWGYADSDNKVIGINVASQSENWRSIFAHELQHLIQVEEGFAIGTGTLSRSGASEEARQRYWGIESGLYDLYKLNEDAERVVYRDELLNAMHRGEYPFGGIDVYTIHFVDWLKKQETEIPIDVLQDGFQESKARAIIDAYHRAGGEVEARNVQTRLNYNDEQRRTTLLSETADVATEDQIIIFEGIKGAGVAEMGSKVTKRMADIATLLSDKELTPEQQKVVNVYTGKSKNETITVKRKNGEQSVIVRQGNETGAGTKHSVYRHYGTQSGYITAEDILLIPEIIANGEVTYGKRGRVRTAEYALIDKLGVKHSVITEYVGGREVFDNYYTNRKALLDTRKTHSEEARDSSSNASVDKDTTINPKNQISEQESFSVSREDSTLPVTPELEAEANEELELSE